MSPMICLGEPQVFGQLFILVLQVYFSLDKSNFKNEIQRGEMACCHWGFSLFFKKNYILCLSHCTVQAGAKSSSSPVD